MRMVGEKVGRKGAFGAFPETGFMISLIYKGWNISKRYVRNKWREVADMDTVRVVVADDNVQLRDMIVEYLQA